MPPVSTAQRKAMFAAAEGKSRLGIPKAVGEEFVGKDAVNGHAAGILFVAPDGDVLVLRRSSAEENYGGHWALPGGKGEDGETPPQTAAREAQEEIGAAPLGRARLLDSRLTPNRMAFHTYALPVDEKFVPKLNGEHSGYAWAPLDQLPQPIHPGVAATLQERVGCAEDMTPEEWSSLRENFAKWTREEEAETEHAEDHALGKDSFALDRASVRRVDQDGHLFVETTPISKANVCPYYGREIPDFKALGLDADKTYPLYRDPDELKKAAPTFAGKPLLRVHTPVSADAHPREEVVGAVGDDVAFRPPYLMAPLRVWDGDAIDLIESGKQKELSCGYRYRADMTPGRTPDGTPYDGVMRDIVGNHVALVEEGRAGPDVVVGDAAMKHAWAGKFALDESEEEKARGAGKLTTQEREEANRTPNEREEMPGSAFLEPASRKYPVKEKRDGKWVYSRDLLLAAAREARMHGHDDLASRADAIRKRAFAQDTKPKEPTMAKILLTRKAAVAQGALMAYLAPKLAQDAKINLTPLLKGVTAKNFKAKRDGIIAGLKTATDGKLAEDANLDDVVDLLDALGPVEPAEDDMAPNNGAPVTELKPRGEDEDPAAKAKVLEFLKDKLSDEDLAACADLFGQEAMDETEEENRANERAGENLKTREDDEKVDKKAMDAAIHAAVVKERQTAQEIAAAKEDVRPYVGAVSIACDSAPDVYKIALDALKIDVKGVHPSAFRAILKSQPVPRAGGTTPRLATDAKAAQSFAERFPTAARITAA